MNTEDTRYPHKAVWPDLSLNLEEIKINPENVALLIIDMQNRNANPEGTVVELHRKSNPPVADYYFNRLVNLVIPNSVKLLSHFRDQHLRVVHVTSGPELPDWSDLFTRRRSGFERLLTSVGKKTTDFVKGLPEHDVIEPLRPSEGELVINKTSSGAFNSTAIDQLLRNLGIQVLVIIGAATNVCVETTARDAADRGYDCILVDDACACFDQTVHDTTMKTFSEAFGFVSKTEKVTELLTARLQK